MADLKTVKDVPSERTVCPSVEELSVIINNIRCNKCGLIFRNEPRYRMHDLKVHQHKKLDKTVKENVRYHCPVKTCVYALESQRYFNTMKYLKQHYLKVHAEKSFACTQCSKGFSTEAAKKAHARICGIEFTCTCLKVFTTYEALLTHAKRSLHVIDDKYKNILRRINSKSEKISHMAGNILTKINKPIAILPYGGESQGINYDNTLTRKITYEVAVQTEECKRTKKITSPTKNNNGSSTYKRKVSKHTQTITLEIEKYRGKSMGTQTINTSCPVEETLKIGKQRKNCLSSKKPSCSLLKDDLGLNDNFGSSNLFPGSPLPLRHDVGLQDFWEEKNTSGTQTSPEKDMFEVLNDNVTQTEYDSFYGQNTNTSIQSVSKSSVALMTLPYVEDASSTVQAYSFPTNDCISRSDPLLTEETFDDKFSSIETQTEHACSQSLFDSYTLSRSFTLSSNIETQTTNNLDNMEQLLYNNTCTQTCNEILPSDLGLSDIQTQTAWTQLDETTVSTETQTKTLMCHSACNIPLGVCRTWLNTQTSHTETQTDILSIFEGLNCP